jgi:glutamyl-Q tRNA(Asp) synthetase
MVPHNEPWQEAWLSIVVRNEVRIAQMKTRFAPSPTGHLHLGHAFAALTAYDAARAAGGTLVLRIEDIDRGRCRPEFEAAIMADLAWLGLDWEQPVRRQSQHFDDYAAALAKLEDLGVLYPCFCTRREIAAEIASAVDAPHGPEGPLYPGTCRMLSAEERMERMEREAYALRLDIAKAISHLEGALHFDERGRGPQGEQGLHQAQPRLLGDVVLARKELPVSYHLAVVVDDALQGIDLVTRGVDLFHATHVQRLLQALLGLRTPVYAHHRLVLDETGKKFSKRDHVMTLRALRAAGATPADIRNRLDL